MGGGNTAPSLFHPTLQSIPQMNILRAESTIKVADKDIKVTLNMATFFKMKELFGVGLEQLDEVLSPIVKDSEGNPILDANGNTQPDETAAIIGIIQLAYCAAVNNAHRQGKEFSMNWLQFSAYAEETPAEIAEVVSDLITRAFATPVKSEESGNE